MEGDNENTDTWIKLAAATANVVRWLQLNEKQNEDRKRNEAKNDHAPEKHVENRTAARLRRASLA